MYGRATQLAALRHAVTRLGVWARQIHTWGLKQFITGIRGKGPEFTSLATCEACTCLAFFRFRTVFPAIGLLCSPPLTKALRASSKHSVFRLLSVVQPEEEVGQHLLDESRGALRFDRNLWLANLATQTRQNLKTPDLKPSSPKLSASLRCYSSLDEAEKCLEYTRKSVEAACWRGGGGLEGCKGGGNSVGYARDLTVGDGLQGLSSRRGAILGGGLREV